MKRFLILLIAILLCFCFTACNDEVEVNERETVIINSAKDDSVNGYRVSSKKSESMPDTIKGELVGTETENKQYTIDSDFSTESSESHTENTSGPYCANVNSKVFHKTSCGSVSKMKDENKAYFSDRAELITQGYSPCKVCNP